jgi:hypothetical protein
MKIQRQNAAVNAALDVPWYYPWAGFPYAERQDLIRGLERKLGTENGEEEDGRDER